MNPKKKARDDFRKAVFARDNNHCVMCGRSDVKLDAHHVTDRGLMPNGGYVPENGVTLCDCDKGCHWKAEHYHATEKAYPGYSPEELYEKIGSSLEKARDAAEKTVNV